MLHGLFGGLAAFAFAVWSFAFALDPKSELSIWVFDVGQGDAIFIETPERYQILIDGGPDGAVVGKLGEVMPFWDRTIDLVVLTHPHSDHVSGLIPVSERYRIGAVIESEEAYGTAEYAEWRRRVAELKIPDHAARSGITAHFGSSTVLAILAPHDSVEDKHFTNPHDGNVAAEINYGKTRVLLMGDAEIKEERDLERRHLLHHVDLLKVGHHGSKTSTAEAFVTAVSPEFAAISVGRKNRYGHPAEAVLEKLEKSGSKIFRTDLDGDLEFTSDGERMRVERKRL